jgi:hypothetical protein
MGTVETSNRPLVGSYGVPELRLAKLNGPNPRQRLVIEIRQSDIERKVINAPLDLNRGQTADNYVGLGMKLGEWRNE